MTDVPNDGGVLDLDAYMAERQWAEGKAVRLGHRDWLMTGALSIGDTERWEKAIADNRLGDAIALLLVNEGDRDGFLEQVRVPVMRQHETAFWNRILNYVTGTTEGEGEAPEPS